MSSDEVNAAGYSHHNFSTSNTSNHMHCHEDDREAMTCSALCSLSASAPPEKQHCRQHHCDFEEDESDGSGSKAKHRVSKTCPSTLPMFLSKTYHMIDKCDPEIATWSESGDNFVVKNVEKFASAILPLYFKHSNFSSFARQLNFYGFRKLRTDPILTTEVDPCTACYVRFYHEKFQRDRPELLQDIKRATKSDQQSRDDIDVLKAEMNQLKETFRATVVDYDRKLAELSYECNRRITSMNAEYDKLLALIQQALGTNVVANNASSTSMLNSLSNALNGSSHMGSSLAALNAIASGTAPITASPPTNTDLLHSLSQAAVSLQNKNNPSLNSNSTKKRSAPESSDSHGATRIRQV